LNKCLARAGCLHAFFLQKNWTIQPQDQPLRGLHPSNLFTSKIQPTG
jgi:hypothetical protein